jgi:hypothetical protein
MLIEEALNSLIYHLCLKGQMVGLRSNPITLPKQDVLAWHLGAKVCRKVCKFICLFICCSFGRYRGLGKVESHLTGGPSRRYQNKDNLHAKRSAKQV